MKKLAKLILTLMLVLAISVSCTSQNEQVSVETPDAEKQNDLSNVNEVLYFKEEGTPLPDGEGVYKIALVSSDPFKGLFNYHLYTDSLDNNIMAPTMKTGMRVDGEYRVVEGAAITPEFDRENKKVRLTLDPKLTWNDGEPVTSKDLEYAYKMVAHFDYTGVRFSKDMKNIVGILDYHYGTMSEEDKKSGKHKIPEGVVPSTEISGVKIIDDKTLEIEFENFGVDILWGAGLLSEPVPYHKFKDIPIKDLESHDLVRKNPLSCGPYYITNMVPGESVEFTSNKYFYRGEPHIGKVVMTILSPDKIVESIKSGEFDEYVGVPTSKYDEIKDFDNVNIAKRISHSYSYIGYKLGKYDKDLKKCVYNPDSKMGDLNLRTAMELALDIDMIGREYRNGMTFRGSTVLPPTFETLHDRSLKPIQYNMEEAKRILDEAGYKDIDGDGKRETPSGEKLEIKVAMMDGDDTVKEINRYYMQQWEDLGLDVKYTNGGLLNFHLFYDLVGADDENIDVFFGAWGVGSNPSLEHTYGETSSWNFSRYVNPELQQLLNDAVSEKAFDDDFRLETYKKIQKHIYEQKPVSLVNYSLSVSVFNKRVSEVDLRRGNEKPYKTLGDIQLLAEEPIKASNN